MKVRIGRRRSRADAKRRLRSPDGLALASAFSEGSWDVPDHFNFTRDVVEVLASDPKRQALMYLGPDGVIEPRSFLQLVEGTARWAELLRQREVHAGDRMLVLVGRTPDWLEIMLAGIKIGAVTVPCPETSSPEALEVRMASSGARIVVASRAAEDAVARMTDTPDVVYTDERRGRARDPVPDEPTEDTEAKDVAFILSTSGTARGPLGVAHTHGATFAARVQAEHWLDAGPRDAVWCTADTSNALAVWNVLLGPWSRGAETIMHHGDFDPDERLDLIDRLGTTILCQTPAEYLALTELRAFHRYRPRRLRRLVSTGDTLDPEVIKIYEEVWGMTIHEGYGQAETAVVVANGVDAGFRPGSVGLPIVGYEVAVVDDQGNVLGPDAEGELAVRGRPPTLFTQYWDAPDETKAAFRGDWYVTGDIASTDDDGFVWLVGRAGDVITSRGHRFGPFDIERALCDHESVAESAVVGMADRERGGQYVRAFVVLDPGVEASEQLEAELRHFVGSSLPEYQVPREIEFVDELPKVPSGNVRRAALRERPVVGRPLWKSPHVVEPEPVVFVTPDPEPVVEPEPEPAGFVVTEYVAPTEPAPPPAPEPTWLVEAEPEPIPVPLDVEPIPLGEPEAVVPLDAPVVPLVEPDPVPPVELEPAAAVESEPVVEPEPVVEQAAEPEPVALVEPEPVVPPELVSYAEPEPAVVPEPVSYEPESEPVALVEPEPVVPPEPVSYAEPEPVVHPEIGTEADPVAEPAAEFEPVAFAQPEPILVPEPTLEPEPHPEPEPVAFVEPVPEPPVVEPEPVAFVEPVPEPPVVEPERVASVSPEQAVEEEPADDALPDYVIAPGAERPREPGPDAPDAGALAFPSTASLKLDRADASETKASKRSRRKPSSKPPEKRDATRSTGEPGDEMGEVDWMQGLSTRLSAYSLADDDPVPSANGEAPGAPREDDPSDDE